MRGFLVVPAVAGLGILLAVIRPGMPVIAKASHDAEAAASIGTDAQCATCHAEIVARYRGTPMSWASGPAAEGFLAGEFTHAASGVRYRMERRSGRVFLRFDRPDSMGAANGALPASGPALSGQREFSYFIGSGKRGRTYLFNDQGFWFESPVNWYAKKRVWDMAPNFLNAKEMPLTLPVDPGCLRCHATGVADSMPGSRNKFVAAPFREGGIRCSACHGDATGHVASGGKIGLTVISSLPAVKRDSICLSCHLEGDEAVVRQDKKLVDFRPGESIFQYAEFFEKGGGTGKAERAASQWEALLGSGCRRGAGERLTCTSCHDPHGSTEGMAEADRVAFYRSRCLSCHERQGDAKAAGAAVATGGIAGTAGFEAPQAGGSFSQRHHPETPDCAQCHMPRVRSSDIAHEQVTDHGIPRVARERRRVSGAAAGTILPISDGSSSPERGLVRDLGLAYAMLAIGGDKAAAAKAESLLGEAEARPEASQDFELHAKLGFLMQVEGAGRAAATEYGLALKAAPYDAFSAANLGILEARSGQVSTAVALVERSFQEVPWEEKTGLNLAILECSLGKTEDAETVLDRVLEFSPDDSSAQQMKSAIRAGIKKCTK